MKVKMGNKIMTLPRDVVAAHMANLITTRAIILQQERDFKKSFDKYKELCVLFLKENKKFIYIFGDDKWLNDFMEFQSKQHTLLMQDVVFKFNDGATWSVSLNDIANLKLIQNQSPKNDKNGLLSSPVELVDWAQNNLDWEQIQHFAVLRSINNPNNTYRSEWKNVMKKVIVWAYEKEKSID